MCFFLFFFFKQKTAYEIVDCDWSSDVCSSDLAESITASSGKAPPVVHWDKAVPSELRNAQGLQLEEDSQQSADEHAAIAATIQPTINTQPRFSPLMTPQPIAPARPNQDGAAQPTDRKSVV